MERCEADHNTASATVASTGAVLRSMHKDAIVERYLRRSFGAAWDEPYDMTIHGNAKTKLDKHDGVRSVVNRIHWLFKLVCLMVFPKAPIVAYIMVKGLIQFRMKQSTEDVYEQCEDGGALH